MNILFICKYNVFRSRVAEEYFKKVNKNRKIRAISRGIIMGGEGDKEQKDIPKKLLGVDITKRKPMPLTLQELIKSNLIVVAANDIPKIIFDYQLMPIKSKVRIWNIKDEQKRSTRNIKAIVLIIKTKVDNLVNELEKRK